MKIQLMVNIDTANCTIIQQGEIESETDPLVVGIYKMKIFCTDTYIVCCNRGDTTLDYTKLCATEELAQNKYIEMINEIQIDQNR
jgi:hypothetical protein